MPITIGDLRKIEFSRQYRWDVLFPSYYIANPAMLLKPMPINDITLTLAMPTTESVSYGPLSIEVISGVGNSELSFTIWETKDYSVLSWLMQWSAACVDRKTMEVTKIAKAAKSCVFMLLDEKNNPSFLTPFALHEFLVIPKGEISYNCNSSKDGVFQISCNFTVVGGFSPGACLLAPGKIPII